MSASFLHPTHERALRAVHALGRATVDALLAHMNHHKFERLPSCHRLYQVLDRLCELGWLCRATPAAGQRVNKAVWMLTEEGVAALLDQPAAGPPQGVGAIHESPLLPAHPALCPVPAPAPAPPAASVAAPRRIDRMNGPPLTGSDDAPVRKGALDFAAVPSLMHGRRVAWRHANPTFTTTTTTTMTPMTTTTTLENLQKRAGALSQLRDQLAALLATLQTEIDTVKHGHLSAITRAARQIARQHTELAELIAANPQLFVKPRSHVVDGLKFGLQKQKGTLTWDDDTALCQRIIDLTGKGLISAEQAGLCIKTRHAPVASALEQLDARLIKRLGITVAADTDAPLIKSVDSEVEKAVNAVIREAARDVNAQVA